MSKKNDLSNSFRKFYKEEIIKEQTYNVDPSANLSPVLDEENYFKDEVNRLFLSRVKECARYESQGNTRGFGGWNSTPKEKLSVEEILKSELEHAKKYAWEQPDGTIYFPDLDMNAEKRDPVKIKSGIRSEDLNAMIDLLKDVDDYKDIRKLIKGYSVQFIAGLASQVKYVIYLEKRLAYEEHIKSNKPHIIPKDPEYATTKQQLLILSYLDLINPKLLSDNQKKYSELLSVILNRSPNKLRTYLRLINRNPEKAQSRKEAIKRNEDDLRVVYEKFLQLGYNEQAEKVKSDLDMLQKVKKIR